MAEEFDFHPMWESLGMNLADHDMLLGAVGQMYGDMFLTQNNRPKSTSYLDFVATNIHSGRIKVPQNSGFRRGWVFATHRAAIP